MCIRDRTDPGVDYPLPGVTVTLFDSAGGVLDTIVTDDNGESRFSVPPGTYTVAVDPTSLALEDLTGSLEFAVTTGSPEENLSINFPFEGVDQATHEAEFADRASIDSTLLMLSSFSSLSRNRSATAAISCNTQKAERVYAKGWHLVWNDLRVSSEVSSCDSPLEYDNKKIKKRIRRINRRLAAMAQECSGRKMTKRLRRAKRKINRSLQTFPDTAQTCETLS